MYRKYDPIIAAVEESKDIDKLTVAELMGFLEAHEKNLEKMPFNIKLICGLKNLKKMGEN